MDYAESYERLKTRRADIQAAEIELALSEAIADLIVGARVRAGMTQTDLAKKASTTQARISEIERGEGNPTLETLARLANALGSNVDATAFLQIIAALTSNNFERVKTPTSTSVTEVVDAVAATRVELSEIAAEPFEFIPLNLSPVEGITFVGGSVALTGFTFFGTNTAVVTEGSTDGNDDEPSETPVAPNSELALAA
jgi:transcriptional regulator with XRE-family HTH domain